MRHTPALSMAALPLLLALFLLAGRGETVSPFIVLSLAGLLSLAAIGLGVVAAQFRLWSIQRRTRKLHNDPWRRR
jgi:hypothetical protein